MVKYALILVKNGWRADPGDLSEDLTEFTLTRKTKEDIELQNQMTLKHDVQEARHVDLLTLIPGENRKRGRDDDDSIEISGDDNDSRSVPQSSRKSPGQKVSSKKPKPTKPANPNAEPRQTRQKKRPDPLNSCV